MVFRRCFLNLSRDTRALQCVGGFLLAHVALLPEVVHHAVLHHPERLVSIGVEASVLGVHLIQ